MIKFRRTVLLTVLLLTAVACVAVASADDVPGPVPSDELPSTVDGVDNLAQHPSASPIAASSVDSTTYVVVAEYNVTRLQIEELRSLGASVEQKHGNLVQVEIDPSVRSAYSDLNWVERLREPFRSVHQNVGGEGASAIGADALHDEGIDGENATVVVIDSGFNPDSTEISDNVVATQGFGTTVDADPKHGTASAEMVLDVAPEADLYLAATYGGIGYRNALDWAVENDADVVTMSLGFLGQPNDGTGSLSQKANEAVEEGDFVFTTSTGNQANRHWQGEFTDTDDDSLLEFNSDGYEVNYLNSNGGQVSPITAGTSLRSVLNWDDWSVANSNYNLYIVYSSSPGGELQYVDRADSDKRGASPTKRSVVTAPSDGYYGVMVEQTHGTDENIELFTSSDLQYRTPESSIVSPAVAEDTVGVGAVRYDTLDVETYSSRGPTNSGSQGVTFLAPTCATSAEYNGPFCGTSGAAPHAGGAAGLLRSEYSLNGTATTDTLEKTSDDIPVPAEVGGSGILNLTRASGSLEQTDEKTPNVTIDAPDTTARNTTFDVAVNVREDGGVTVLEFSPDTLELNLSANSDQAPVVSINGDRVRFGSLGYTGTYTAQVNVTGGDRDRLNATAWVGDIERRNASATTNATISLVEEMSVSWCPRQKLRTRCRALANSQGDPAGEIKVIRVLTEWNDTGEINGVSTSEIGVVRLLVAWNEAR